MLQYLMESLAVAFVRNSTILAAEAARSQPLGRTSDRTSVGVLTLFLNTPQTLGALTLESLCPAIQQ